MCLWNAPATAIFFFFFQKLRPWCLTLTDDLKLGTNKKILSQGIPIWNTDRIENISHNVFSKNFYTGLFKVVIVWWRITRQTLSLEQTFIGLLQMLWIWTRLLNNLNHSIWYHRLLKTLSGKEKNLINASNQHWLLFLYCLLL